MSTLPNFARFLNEAYKFSALQAKKEALSEDERKKVMDAKAVWHHGPNGKPSPAVWKSRDSQGNPVYVTHTHRAFAAEKTLGAAIRKYHSFIKDTA